MESDDYLMISGIQHFSFCRRQWALIHIEQLWSENSLTAEGRVMHSRVHDNVRDVRNGIITIRGLRIKSEKYHITGVCDAVEFIPCEDGITLRGKSGTWRVQPVEYKHGDKKYNDCDRLQAAAQALCLEEMFSCRIDTAAVFYCESRKRETIPLDDEIREKVRASVEEMYELYKRGYTPVVKETRKCRNCSLSELCLPALMCRRGKKSVNEYISGHITEELP